VIAYEMAAGNRPFLGESLATVFNRILSQMPYGRSRFWISISIRKCHRRWIRKKRGEKVMLSTHLADLYEVEPRVLVQAVKRNIARFPSGFMFQLNADEFRILKSQFVISSWGGMRHARPYAFTEQGVAMLSSVLNSERAIKVNSALSILSNWLRLVRNSKAFCCEVDWR
jgi:hypothetical protein